jgi:hypothetical protein
LKRTVKTADGRRLAASVYGDPEGRPVFQRVVAHRGIRSLLLAAYAEALRISEHGWIDDDVAFHAPWGFDPAAVTVPVLLWHGASDTFSPLVVSIRQATHASTRHMPRRTRVRLVLAWYRGIAPVPGPWRV